MACVSLVFYNTKAQILDDSTKQVYGPFTTEFTYEDNIKYNDPQVFPMDTLIRNQHRFNFVNAGDNKFQDLGNVGTAIRSLYYQIPQQIGIRSGFHAFDHYFLDPRGIRYYNTKSPYTKLSAVFGGNGRSLVDVSFSRSDSTVFNMGFDFKRITSDKQVGATLSRDDRNVVSTAYDVYARWHPGKYQLIANFSRLRTEQFESGGVMPLPSGSLDDLFNVDSAEVWLNSTITDDRRNNWHLFHQYQVSEWFQFYHQLDLNSQQINFDSDLGTDGEFFDQILINESTTADAHNVKTINNELGIKGLHKGIFYNFFLTRRDVQYFPKYLPATGYQTEYYLGAKLRYRLAGQTLSFQGLLQDGGSYSVKGAFDNRFIEASYTRVQYDPAFLHQDYFGNHGEWHNSFTSPTADVLSARLKVETSSFRIYPAFALTNVNDHIYFSQSKVPDQASGAAQILVPEVSLDWSFLTNLNFQGQVMYAEVTGDAREVFRIPKWLINAKLSYASWLFKEKLELQFGVDAQYRSAYFGHDYLPQVQQYFIQDDFEIPEYLLADFFVNFRVGRALLFMKLVFLNQGLNRPGYFTAPYYLGQKRVFDWGVTWRFYD